MPRKVRRQAPPRRVRPTTASSKSSPSCQRLARKQVMPAKRAGPPPKEIILASGAGVAAKGPKQQERQQKLLKQSSPFGVVHIHFPTTMTSKTLPHLAGYRGASDQSPARATSSFSAFKLNRAEFGPQWTRQATRLASSIGSICPQFVSGNNPVVVIHVRSYDVSYTGRGCGRCQARKQCQPPKLCVRHPDCG